MNSRYGVSPAAGAARPWAWPLLRLLPAGAAVYVALWPQAALADNLGALVWPVVIWPPGVVG